MRGPVLKHKKLIYDFGRCANLCRFWNLKGLRLHCARRILPAYTVVLYINIEPSKCYENLFKSKILWTLEYKRPVFQLIFTRLYARIFIRYILTRTRIIFPERIFVFSLDNMILHEFRSFIFRLMALWQYCCLLPNLCKHWILDIKLPTSTLNAYTATNSFARVAQRPKCTIQGCSRTPTHKIFAFEITSTPEKFVRVRVCWRAKCSIEDLRECVHINMTVSNVCVIWL